MQLTNTYFAKFFHQASCSAIALPGISPFVENPGIAELTKPLPFKQLGLDAGLPQSYMNLIETKPSGNATQPRGL